MVVLCESVLFDSVLFEMQICVGSWLQACQKSKWNLENLKYLNHKILDHLSIIDGISFESQDLYMKGDGYMLMQT